MNEKSLMHGRDYEGEDLAGWHYTVKLDGCCGAWDGERMWSRSGRQIAIPEDWRATLPRLRLDGEIYSGQGTFSGEDFTAASVAVRTGRFTAGIRFHIFNVAGKEEWIARLDRARAALRGCDFAEVASPAVFADNDHAGAELRRVLAAGMEGLIARHPREGEYRAGRTASIVKLKLKALRQLLPTRAYAMAA